MDPISKTGRSDNIAQQGALAVVKVRLDEHAARALLKAPLLNPGVASLEELINLNDHQGSDKEITEISARNPV